MSQPSYDQCSICHDKLQRDMKILEYCAKSCGNSFHSDCIKKWKAQSIGQAKDLCPLCRQDWPTDDDQIRVHQFPDLNKTGYSVYQEWLYRGMSYIESLKEESGSNPDFVRIIRANIICNQVKDNDFCDALISLSLDSVMETRQYPGSGTIDWVYSKTLPASPLRKLLVQMYGNFSDPDWFTGIGGRTFPHQFLLEVRAAKFSISKPGKYRNLEMLNENFVGIDHCSGVSDENGSNAVENENEGRV